MRLSLALAALAALCALLAVRCDAQVAEYVSGPSRWYTFDTHVNRTYEHTSYDWQYGRAPHIGRAQFNGLDQYIDLFEMPDDNNQIFPSLLPFSVSFEFWVQWNELRFWSRIFDCGNGVLADNILLSNRETTNDFHAAFYRGDLSVNQNSIAPRAIFPNTWQHIVVTIAQKFLNDSSSDHAASINIYIDGVLVSKNENAYLLRSVNRANCFIGKSEWPNDEMFSGWIDDFFYYNYPLSAEQASVHFVLPRPPIYELTFSADPRVITSAQPPAQGYTYSWQRFSPGDNSTVAQFHEGHLDLSGNQFVDLTATRRDRRESWTGADVLPTIGGWIESGASGTLPRGWSIECMFKVKQFERWAKVFDLGNGQADDNVVLGFRDETHDFQFEIYTTFGEHWNQSVLPNVIAPIVLNQWYQVVIVLEPFRENSLQGSVKAYVDGRLVTQASPFNMPLRVPRLYSFIGKSNWAGPPYNDEYIDMDLDAFRVYDYALVAAEIRDLFDVTHEKMPEPEIDQQRDFRYTSWPIASYTFTNQTQAQQQQGVEGTSFTWSAGQYPRLGIANFNSSRRNYVNLQYYPSNAAGDVLPRLGGSVSFECWARWNSLRSWSRVFDLGSRQPTEGNNILLGNMENSDTLVLDVYGGELHNSLHAPQAIVVGQWHHIVVVAEQRQWGDTTSAESARIRLYVDGRLRNEILGFLPMQIARPNSFLGRSNWQWDEYFDGSIDSFLYYDYALNYEQVAAHYLLPKPPAFELAFSLDPRPWINWDYRDQFTYKWEEFDPLDQQTNNTQNHAGHLVLDGDDYVNLTSWSGRDSMSLDSVGTGVPSVLFGASAYANSSGGVNAYNGWSIEVVAKFLRHENGAKVFDFSNGKEIDEVALGFDWTRPSLVFAVYSPAVPAGQNFPVIDNVESNRWYHIMITGRRTNNQGTRGAFTAYVDGVQTHEAQNFPFPRGVARSQCYLGKSAWPEDFIDIRLDTFRIYDFIVLPEVVTKLYEITQSELSNPPKALYTSGPLNEWTFDEQPADEQWNGGTQFTWMEGSGDHRGVAHFDGQTEFINLLAFADDTGTPFPTLMGNGSFSFEFWAMYESLGSWSRLIDLGNSNDADNILVANEAETSTIAFHTYLGPSGSFLNTGSPTFVNLSYWHHIVVTLDDLTPYNSAISPTSATAALKSIFVDGRQVAVGLGYRPRAVERLFAYVGKSHWVDNALFKGSLDSFYYYDYALSGEQINVHRRMPRPPVFDLSFSLDPRPRLGGFGLFYTYRWQEYDPSDTIGPDARFHSGHVVLDSSLNNFINLSTPVGINSVGVVLPGIGGKSYGRSGTRAGWSFEVIAKMDTVGRWAKLFDWGNGDSADNILLGYVDNSNALRFQVFNSFKNPGGDAGMTVIDNVQLGRWYHIVITMEPTNEANWDARWRAYVDGSWVAQLEAGWLPRNIIRSNALIGRSNWQADQYFSGKIDAIRVYDYVISEAQAATLYSLVHDASSIPVPRASSSSSTGRAMSSSARPSSSSSSRVSSSSSSRRPLSPQYCYDMFDGQLEGTWPNCVCPEENPDCNVWCIENPDDEFCVAESASTGSTPGVAGGLTTAAVIGIVFAIIVGVAAVAYLYMRYCRNAPSSDYGNMDGKTSLLGDTRLGVERDNQYSQWVPPSAATGANPALASTDSSSSTASHF